MVAQRHVSATYLTMCLQYNAVGPKFSAISGITRNQGNVVSGVFIVVLW
jgi:hypothetical protein